MLVNSFDTKFSKTAEKYENLAKWISEKYNK